MMIMMMMMMMMIIIIIIIIIIIPRALPATDVASKTTNTSWNS
jgi:hypothetical protein